MLLRFRVVFRVGGLRYFFGSCFFKRGLGGVRSGLLWYRSVIVTGRWIG